MLEPPRPTRLLTQPQELSRMDTTTSTRPHLELGDVNLSDESDHAMSEFDPHSPTRVSDLLDQSDEESRDGPPTTMPKLELPAPHPSPSWHDIPPILSPGYQIDSTREYPKIGGLCLMKTGDADQATETNLTQTDEEGESLTKHEDDVTKHEDDLMSNPEIMDVNDQPEPGKTDLLENVLRLCNIRDEEVPASEVRVMSSSGGTSRWCDYDIADGCGMQSPGEEMGVSGSVLGGIQPTVPSPLRGVEGCELNGIPPTVPSPLRGVEGCELNGIPPTVPSPLRGVEGCELNGILPTVPSPLRGVEGCELNGIPPTVPSPLRGVEGCVLSGIPPRVPSPLRGLEGCELSGIPPTVPTPLQGIEGVLPFMSPQEPTPLRMEGFVDMEEVEEPLRPGSAYMEEEPLPADMMADNEGEHAAVMEECSAVRDHYPVPLKIKPDEHNEICPAASEPLIFPSHQDKCISPMLQKADAWGKDNVQCVIAQCPSDVEQNAEVEELVEMPFDLQPQAVVVSQVGGATDTLQVVPGFTLVTMQTVAALGAGPSVERGRDSEGDQHTVYGYTSPSRQSIQLHVGDMGPGGIQPATVVTTATDTRMTATEVMYVLTDSPSGSMMDCGQSQTETSDVIYVLADSIQSPVVQDSVSSEVPEVIVIDDDEEESGMEVPQQGTQMGEVGAEIPGGVLPETDVNVVLPSCNQVQGRGLENRTVSMLTGTGVQDGSSGYMNDKMTSGLQDQCGQIGGSAVVPDGSDELGRNVVGIPGGPASQLNPPSVMPPRDSSEAKFFYVVARNIGVPDSTSSGNGGGAGKAALGEPQTNIVRINLVPLYQREAPNQPIYSTASSSQDQLAPGVLSAPECPAQMTQSQFPGESSVQSLHGAPILGAPVSAAVPPAVLPVKPTSQLYPACSQVAAPVASQPVVYVVKPSSDPDVAAPSQPGVYNASCLPPSAAAPPPLTTTLRPPGPLPFHQLQAPPALLAPGLPAQTSVYTPLTQPRPRRLRFQLVHKPEGPPYTRPCSPILTVAPIPSPTPPDSPDLWPKGYARKNNYRPPPHPPPPLPRPPPPPRRRGRRPLGPTRPLPLLWEVPPRLPPHQSNGMLPERAVAVVRPVQRDALCPHPASQALRIRCPLNSRFSRPPPHYLQYPIPRPGDPPRFGPLPVAAPKRGPRKRGGHHGSRCQERVCQELIVDEDFEVIPPVLETGPSDIPEAHSGLIMDPPHISQLQPDWNDPEQALPEWLPEESRGDLEESTSLWTHLPPRPLNAARIKCRLVEKTQTKARQVVPNARFLALTHVTAIAIAFQLGCFVTDF